MLQAIAKKVFGSANDRMVRNLQRDVDAINGFEPELQGLSDDELRGRVHALRERAAGGESLDKLLHETFAIVREGAVRTLGLRHFDVQLIGGMVQHRGMISEMKTGEGKTLVATLAATLNALAGKGVHIVTVNDYLAKRDAEWMGQIYRFLGLTVGTIVHDMEDTDRRAAYACDITYGTNNELGFDYLRDNMKYAREQMVQRPFNFAIVDEVDSILIDEARTPLIISGPTEDNSELYQQVDAVIPQLLSDSPPVERAAKTAAGLPNAPTRSVTTTLYFDHDEKSRSITLTEEGTERMEQLLRDAGLIAEGTGLYDLANVSLVHHVNQSLKAHKIFTRDVDYIVKDGKVVIIDEFTGRMMEGRRYSEGLHQALEAKEKVQIQNENQTLASITFQNYFRLYPKLAGMTGTAMTEAAEFNDIYKLDTVDIPTNVPVARLDEHDEIYRTGKERDKAVINLIKELHGKGQPVLVGTVSIEKSEAFSKQLKAAGIKHNVLNARQHEHEAFIIAQAGYPGAVTIATNMAGRGTDIQLGGNLDMRLAQEAAGLEGAALEQKRNAIKAEIAANKEKVLAAGGLFVIGTERHESRRIDNQLRGRSGRQGDPGASKFFLSLQDDLMRIFGSERIDAMLVRLGLKEDEAIFHPWMNKAIERAQTKVEERNYEVRKSVLKFDDVMNDQRKVIYEQRIELMDAEDVSESIDEMRLDTNASMVGAHMPQGSYPEQWDTHGLHHELLRIYGLEIPVAEWAAEEGIADEEVLKRVNDLTDAQAAERRGLIDAAYGRIAEKRLLLQTLDQLWKDHLLSLDHLRQGIYLRAYAQRDPLNEYKQEAFSLFEHMLEQLREVVTQRSSRLRVSVEVPMLELPQQEMHESRIDPAMGAFPQPAADGEEMERAKVTPIRTNVKPEARHAGDPGSWGKVARNEPCPCGSGKKYKHCHGALS